MSAYATRGICADVLRLVLAEHDLVVGTVVLEELEEVLLRKMRVPPGLVGEITDALRDHVRRIEGESAGDPRVSDAADARVLAEAIESSADVLVTGDHDLLDVAGAVTELRILSPRGFWELLRRR